MQRNACVAISLSILAAIATSYPVGAAQCPPERSADSLKLPELMSKKVTELFTYALGHANLPAYGDNIEIRFTGFTSYIKEDAAAIRAEKKDRLTELGYELINGRYYKYHDGGVDWWTANRTCAEEGAYLVIINSIEEAHLVGRIFSRHPASDTDYPSQLYVGLNDLANEGEFVTIFGDSIRETGYVNWRRGQPSNNKDINPAGENCVSIFRLQDLNDIHCNAKLAFICEATVE